MDELEPSLPNRYLLQKQAIVGGPITSVVFFRNGESILLLAAQGPNLLCYSLYEKDPIASYKPFQNGGTIHGIRFGDKDELSVSNDVMFVFGGRQLAFVRTATSAENEPRFTPLHLIQPDGSFQSVITVSDWIWDANLIYGNSRNKGLTLVVAMAHNVAHKFQIENQEDCYRIASVERIVCSKRCITYSMSLYRSAANDLLIAAGTVENEVLLWTVSSVDETAVADDETNPPVQYKQVNHVLKGHKGVIHSVTVAQCGMYVASTSDDRTVRLWKRMENNNIYKLMWTGWGHTARIWDCCITRGVVISVGEDGTARIWSLYSGNHRGVFRGQRVKSFWTVASLHKGCDSAWIATGGNDGTVKLWSLSAYIESLYEDVEKGEEVQEETIPLPNNVRLSLVVPNDDKSSPDAPNDGTTQQSSQEMHNESEELINPSQTKSKKKKKKKKKRVGQVVFGMKFHNSIPNDYELPDKLLVATRAGSLLSYDLANSDWTRLQPWLPPVTSKEDNDSVGTMNGSCIAIHNRESIVAIGTTRGHVVLASLQATKDPGSVPTTTHSEYGKSVQGIDWLDSETLVVFDIKGVVILWKLQAFAGDRFQLELQHVLHTGTVSVPMSFAKSRDLLFVGDSRGNVVLFDLSDNKKGTSPTIVEPQHPIGTFTRAHKKEHVTDMLFDEHMHLLSVGNDGCISECIVFGDDTTKPVCYRKATSIPIASLSGIARIWRLPNGSIAAGGYYGNRFAIIDVTSGFEFCKFDTGGRQRTLDCFLSADGNTVSYGIAVCTTLKDGANKILLNYSFPKVILGQTSSTRYNFGVGLHGETIFDASWLCLSNDTFFVLSGSEDCSARLSLYQSSGTLTQSRVLQPHGSGIRAVCCSLGIRDSLLVTAGGKLSVQFYSVVHSHRSATKCFPPVIFLGRGRYASMNDTIDHRINAVKAIQLHCNDRGENVDEPHLVVTGDSNGGLHSFLVSTTDYVQQSSKPCRLLHRSERPILSLELVRIDDLRLLLLAGTTSGDVLAWILPGFTVAWDDLLNIPSLATYKAHQMGTNSLSAMAFEHFADNGRELMICICSGGDDQAISICKARLERHDESSYESTIKILDVKVTREASSSAIKGVCFIDRDLVVSVGYSQQFAVWVLKNNQLSLASSTPVDVGDVNCLSFCVQGKESHFSGGAIGVAAVGGEGLEFISVRSSVESRMEILMKDE